MLGTVVPASALSRPLCLCTYDLIMIYGCGLDIIVVWFVLVHIVLVLVEDGDFVVCNSLARNFSQYSLKLTFLS